MGKPYVVQGSSQQYTITALPLKLSAINTYTGKLLARQGDPAMTADEAIKIEEDLDLLLPKIFAASSTPKDVEPQDEILVYTAIQAVTQKKMDEAECFRKSLNLRPAAAEGGAVGLVAGSKAELSAESGKQRV